MYQSGPKIKPGSKAVLVGISSQTHLPFDRLCTIVWNKIPGLVLCMTSGPHLDEKTANLSPAAFEADFLACQCLFAFVQSLYNGVNVEDAAGPC